MEIDLWGNEIKTKNKSLDEKVKESIKIIKMLSLGAKGEPIEVSYSGGKDSDVILRLVQMSGVPYRAIYKNTTIDPAGTIKHCLDNGVEILHPQEGFFKLLERKGYPSRRTRFCCEKLKEYKVLDYSVQGIRASESAKRRERYKEPIICRTYTKKEHVNVALPILEWSDDDVAQFISEQGIKCHPLYYGGGGYSMLSVGLVA